MKPTTACRAGVSGRVQNLLCACMLVITSIVRGSRAGLCCCLSCRAKVVLRLSPIWTLKRTGKTKRELRRRVNDVTREKFFPFRIRPRARGPALGRSRGRWGGSLASLRLARRRFRTCDSPLGTCRLGAQPVECFERPGGRRNKRFAAAINGAEWEGAGRAETPAGPDMTYRSQTFL